MSVPTERIRCDSKFSIRPEGNWVLYWMTAFRRIESNFALQHARDLAKQLDRPLIILEALRVRYGWACDRFHRFVIEGMQDNKATCKNLSVEYFSYVEPTPGKGSGLVAALAEESCVVVTDDFPCFFHPAMIKISTKHLPARLEVVDSNCLMPLRVPDRTFTVAHSYRRYMQKVLPTQLAAMPDEEPLSGVELPGLSSQARRKLSGVKKRWPEADLERLTAPEGMRDIPIDHGVEPCGIRGGPQAANETLQRFLSQRLASYSEDRNEPDEHGSSELSPYLHFGHISPHSVFAAVMEKLDWNPSKLSKPNGKMNGFWGVPADTEAFLDQLCTWREIGFNMCVREPDFDRFDSLPDWAQETLHTHSQDERPYQYTLEQFEAADTHDEIWNAAQRQLVVEGRIHNYMRMLWGKKILHWAESPQEALRIMIHLNNKYALDGRDPNSYSGIFWVLGRYDRAWGPERDIFGKVRYMTSENTAKKHRLKEYLKRYSD